MEKRWRINVETHGQMMSIVPLVFGPETQPCVLDVELSAKVAGMMPCMLPWPNKQIAKRDRYRIYIFNKGLGFSGSSTS